MIYTVVSSPLGDLLATADGLGLTALYLPDGRGRPDPAAWRRDDAAFADLRAQLAEYFAGRRVDFDLSLDERGTDFQRGVWQALRQIPYGQTTSYGALAAQLGCPKAVRAVGLANGRNPISIITPCHRVIGADGSLTGYGGGLPAKRWLLEHETVHRPDVTGPVQTVLPI